MMNLRSLARQQQSALSISIPVLAEGSLRCLCGRNHDGTFVPRLNPCELCQKNRSRTGSQCFCSSFTSLPAGTATHHHPDELQDCLPLRSRTSNRVLKKKDSSGWNSMCDVNRMEEYDGVPSFKMSVRHERQRSVKRRTILGSDDMGPLLDRWSSA